MITRTIILGTVLLMQLCTAKLQLGYYDGDQLNGTEYSARLGHTPAAKMDFFPINATGFRSEEHVHNFLLEVATELPGAAPVLTLQPNDGLHSCSDDALTSISRVIVAGAVEHSFSAVYVRFAPEMNAPWNKWGEEKDPKLYKETFQRLTNILRDTASQAGIRDRVFTIWSPNVHYVGLPLPYDQFFPGTEYVDWVGLSCYAPKFNASRGPVSNTNFRMRVTTAGHVDFYQTYSDQLKKPMFLETGAPVPLKTPRDKEMTYKLSWAAQIYNTRLLLDDMPRLQMVVWLETTTNDNSFGVMHDRAMAKAFVDALPEQSLMQYGEDALGAAGKNEAPPSEVLSPDDNKSSNNGDLLALF